MSTTSQPTTFQDLYTDLQNRVRVQTGVTATENQAKRYINIALQDMHLGFDYTFPWCERRAVLLSQATYTTGTLSVSVGSTTITGSGTAWNTNTNYGVATMRAGGKLLIAGGNDIYRIASVTNDTTATLETRYVAASAASAVTYLYFEDEYALASDFLRPLDMQMFSPELAIRFISRVDFRRMYPRPNRSGRPQVATILDLSHSSTTTPVRKVQLYPYPAVVYQIPYAYITSTVAVSAAGAAQTELSAATDEPNVPLRYRYAIVLHALANWYRDKKDDARSQEVKAEYVDIVSRIASDQDIGTHLRTQIQPRMGWYTNAAKTPWRRQTGRIYDLNDDFDYFRR